MADRLSPQTIPAAPLNHPPAPSTTRRRDLLELSIGYALILLIIWTPPPYQRIFYISTIIYIAIVLLISFRSTQAMGLRSTNFFRSLWIVGLAILLAAIAITLALAFHTLHPIGTPIQFLQRYWGYALWSFAQQILLQDFFLRRLLRLIPNPHTAVFATAGIFALAHLPSPVLTIVTLTLGLVACLLFLRYRNIYPLAISHAILGITIAITIPNPIIRKMRVGLGYINYHEDHPHHRNHSDHVVSTKAWLIADAPTLRF